MTPQAKSLRLFQAAFFLGVAPCFAACLVFDFWLVTRHPGLVVAAVAILLGGPAALLLAAVFLALHVRAERALDSPVAFVSRAQRLGGIVLLMNLLIGCLLVFAIFASSESYSISVRNQGRVAIDSFTIIDQSRSERRDLGAFAPGEERTVAVHIKGRTTLLYEMNRFGQVSTGTISGYTEPNLAAEQWATITVGDDGKPIIEESSSPGP